MLLDFPVRIEKKTVGVSERGFGTILIFNPRKDIDYTLITPEEVFDTPLLSGELKSIASRIFMQKPVPQQVAVFGRKVGEGGLQEGLTELIEMGHDWFFLVSDLEATEDIVAISEFAQTNEKIYGVTVHDLNTVEKLKAEVFENTLVAYHSEAGQYIAEPLLVTMSYDIGGKTAKFKQLQGVKGVDITATEFKQVHDAKVITYIEKLGVLQTTEGTVLSGEYLDVVLGEYWIRFRMEEALQRLALTNGKIPYTDTGIGMLVGEVSGVLQRAVRQGIVEEGQYKVDYLMRADVPTNDVANRVYDHIRWTAMLQGAIHKGQIFGVLTYDMVNEEEV